MVTPQQIRTETNKALEGSKKVRITFGVRNMDDTRYLLAMAAAGIVELSMLDEAVMMSVAQSRNWERDRNRALVITLGSRFDTELFSGRMCRALDKIEAV